MTTYDKISIIYGGGIRMNQIFPSLSAGLKVRKDPLKNGEFICLSEKKKDSYFVRSLGKPEGVSAFICAHREQPFFMSSSCGKKIKDLPEECQWVALRHTDGSYTVLLPLIDEPFRASLRGNKAGEIELVIETGDIGTIGDSAVVLYAANGDNPYTLMEEAGKSVANQIKTCKRRVDKPVPAITDYFGWCTWDAFYEKVDTKGVKEGLESFKKGGFVPKFLLLDDGWQSVWDEPENRGHHQLSSFLPNGKFNHNMHETVELAKKKYGVRMFYVWHAIMGYWGGVSATSAEMAPFAPKNKAQQHSKGMYSVNPSYSSDLVFPYGFVDPDKAFNFYNAYHRYLSAEGVDGVKVDVQAALEGVGYAAGGRVRVARKFHEGLEGSVHRNFGGELINCMSCSNDIIYNTEASNLMRSSDDYFPNRPESHGVHIYRNAVNSMWMSEFTHCDWDMFQTTHEFGWFHAAARAVSGGPVYVSDTIDGHDFELIDRLVLSDGTLPRAIAIARPTLDSLFRDPMDGKHLFKIFNYNRYGGVVAAFNMEANIDGKVGKTVTDQVSPSDVDGYESGNYAVYSHHDKTVTLLAANRSQKVTLNPQRFDIFTVMPVEAGFAPIGLAGKFNSGATIVWAEWKAENEYSVTLKDGGEFVAYTEEAPKEVLVNGKKAKFDFGGNKLTVQANGKGQTTIRVLF